MTKVTLESLKEQLDRIEALLQAGGNARGDVSTRDTPEAVQEWRSPSGVLAARLFPRGPLELYFGPHEGGWTKHPLTKRPLAWKDQKILIEQALGVAP